MKKTVWLFLLLLPLFLTAADNVTEPEFEFKRQFDVPLINAKWSCFQCSVQPFRPYMHLFPSGITVTGINFSFFTSQWKTAGFTMALIDCDEFSSGITMAVFNNSYTFTGVSMAIISWQTRLRGAAFSLVNITDRLSKGLQCGLVNVSESDYQIGLVNWNRNGWVRCAPFFNFGVDHRSRREGVTD